MTYTIEKHVPIPTSGKGAGVSLLATLREMTVGDSVLVPGKSSTDRVSGNTFQLLRKENKRFIRRVVEGGVRVWRVE